MLWGEQDVRRADPFASFIQRRGATLDDQRRREEILEDLHRRDLTCDNQRLLSYE